MQRKYNKVYFILLKYFFFKKFQFNGLKNHDTIQDNKSAWETKRI